MNKLRIAILTGLAATPLVFGQSGGAAAQSQFCATYSDDAMPEDCSFPTMALCEQAVSGVGGSCAPQASAPVMPPPPLFQFRPDPYAFSPAPVPPPPISNQPALPGPMPLPDAPPSGN